MKRLGKWVLSKLGWIFGAIIALFTFKLFRGGGNLLPDTGDTSDRVKKIEKKRTELKEERIENDEKIDDEFDCRIDAFHRRIREERRKADGKESGP